MLDITRTSSTAAWSASSLLVLLTACYAGSENETDTDAGDTMAVSSGDSGSVESSDGPPTTTGSTGDDSETTEDSETGTGTGTALPANEPPNAAFDATPPSGPAPLAVTFDASPSFDSDGTIVQYDWEFGDGSTGSGLQAAHTFSDPGCYTVTLSVTDDRDDTDTTDAVFVVTGAGEPALTVSASPLASAVLPRSLDTNEGTAHFAGTVQASGWGAFLQAEVLVGGAVTTTTTMPLCGEAPFEFTLDVPIPAELVSHDVALSVVSGAQVLPLVTVPDLVAGDHYIVQGQSNAASNTQSGNPNADYQGPFVRSFGRNVTDAQDTVADVSWRVANGSTGYGPGGIGQWPLVMAATLSERHQVPLAVFNGALGGAAIGFFPRNDGDPANPSTNYGRLLTRVRAAGVEEHIRGILWYQGESDAGNWTGHAEGFLGLYEDWLVDYPNVERTYVTQVRAGCLGDLIALQEFQRSVPDMFEAITAMSTTAIQEHDGCHFQYEGGTRVIGDRYANLLGRDLYGEQPMHDVQPPNPESARFANGGTAIVITMRNKESSLVAEPGVEGDFLLHSGGVGIVSSSAMGNEVTLQLSGDGSSATGLTYFGHKGPGKWVLNENGIGMLAFWGLPIAPE